MKTNNFMRFAFLLLPAILLSGCVDRDYDLSKIDDGDDIVLGDLLEMPLGRITYSIDDIFDDLNTYVSGLGFDPSMIGQVAIPLDITNLTVYEMDVEIGGNIGDILNDIGDIKLVVEGENHIPLDYTLTLEFVFSDEYGDPENVSYSIGPVDVDAGSAANGSPFETVVSLDSRLFEAICRSREIRISMISTLDDVVFHRDDYLYAAIYVEKTGGINFENF